MSNKNYYLIRSPKELVEDGYVGYGWGKVDFSKSTDSAALLDEIKVKYNSYGRKKNMIQRFFSLKKNDIVIVPMRKSIAVGIVIGEKSFHDNPDKGYNRVSVNFKNGNGSIRKISTRTNVLTTSLLSRLRLRQSNSSLNGFSDEIDKLINMDFSDNGIPDLFEDALSKSESKFKDKLLNNLRTGKNLRLKAGGDGFEILICELLEIEGFKTEIPSKKFYKGGGDIDITATRAEFFGKETLLAIQAKHHRGKTSMEALKQIVTAIEHNEVNVNAISIVISTADFEKLTIEEAKDNNITLINGSMFIDWLYQNLSKLSIETQLKLGVSQVPSLIE